MTLLLRWQLQPRESRPAEKAKTTSENNLTKMTRVKRMERVVTEIDPMDEIAKEMATIQGKGNGGAAEVEEGIKVIDDIVIDTEFSCRSRR